MSDPTIPAGMKPWAGGPKPADWDGKSVQFRSGHVMSAEPGVVWKLGWDHCYGDGDIIAYTPALSTPTTPDEGPSPSTFASETNKDRSGKHGKETA